MVKTSVACQDSSQVVQGRVDTALDSKSARSYPSDDCIGVDIVTNDARAKPSDVMRILSPERPRRTPVLVKAPEVRWRLGPSPRLAHVLSLDSIVSSLPSSASSADHHPPVRPQGISLPSSSSSSVVTVLSRGHPATIHTQSPPPPRLRAEYVDRTRQLRCFDLIDGCEPHLLSPVTEASVAQSICSSIIDLTVQDVGTAERMRIDSVCQQNVNIIDQTRHVVLGLSGSEVQHDTVMPSIKRQEQDADYVTTSPYAQGLVQAPVHTRVDEGKTDTKQGLCEKIRRFRERAKAIRGKVIRELGRKLAIRALARVL